jgi:hypothetical protein
MAESLNPCCRKTREHYLQRLRAAVTSYPVIKNSPCPTCSRIIPIRLYVPPDQAERPA